MKKTISMAVLAAVLTATGATATFAESTEQIDVEGIRFEIPASIKDMVTVRMDGLEDNELVMVSETASIDAAKALGEEAEGAGWLFTIGTTTEDEVTKARTSGDCDGKDFFATDGETYVVFYHPTDVRYVRETTEEMDEDEADWSKVNEWAFESVRNEIVENNPDLEETMYSYTPLDTYLCKIADGDTVKYEIHYLKYPDLDASKLEDYKEFLDKLTNDVKYEYIEEVENPGGQYIVLDFPEDGTRYEFLTIPEMKNIIREVVTTDGEESSYYYQATFKDPEMNVLDIMTQWVEAIAESK